MGYKVCLECRKPMVGRRDKKFCDDNCRNTFHNRLNSERPMSVRAVNTILSKNRRIISRFIHEHPDEEISSSALARLGFNFEYFTGQGIKENKIYNQCYEFGYVCEDDGHYKVFKLSTKKQESDNL